jgi:hypothetical protein
MNSFLYSHCNLVPRRVRHAQIEYRSAEKKSKKKSKNAEPIEASTSTRRECLPMVVLGQFFCLDESRLDLRREEMGSADRVQSYSMLGEDTPAGRRVRSPFDMQRCNAPSPPHAPLRGWRAEYFN